MPSCDSPRRPTSRSLLGVVALGLVMVARQASAQTPPEMEARRALLEQARVARMQGQHQRALELIERAGQISMNSSLRRAEVQELQALQRWADALGQANECVSYANREPATPSRDQVLADCQQLVTTLETHVGRVVVQVPSPVPAGLVVRVNDHEIPSAVWGVPYPVDAGHAVIAAQSPGRQAFHRDVDVTSGASVPVAVTLDPIVVAVAPPVVVPPRATSRGPTVPQIALMVVGGVGVVTGAVMLGLRLDATSRLDAECPSGNDPVCPYGSGGLITQANVGNVGMITGFAVGVAAAAGGVGWWLWGSRHADRAQAFHVVVGPSQLGVVGVW